MSWRLSERCAMGGLALALVAEASAGVIQSPSPSPSPSPTPAPIAGQSLLSEQSKQGRLPYHQLTLDDFPVKDPTGGKNDYFVQAFMEPRYEGFLYFNRGWVHAYIKTWQVLSGFDKSASYRSKRFREMKDYLPAAQAILDLNEIRARELAVMPPEGWPEYRGSDKTEVKAGLEARVRALCQLKYDQAQADIDAFLKATDEGRDRKKVAKMAKEIRRRLDALPTAATPSSATPMPTVLPSPTPVAKGG